MTVCWLWKIRCVERFWLGC